MGKLTVSDALLADVNNYLDNTWKDEARDRKILGFIRSGMVRIDKWLGKEADYESAGDPRTLLFEFVRYARDGAMDLFETNYRSMILAMQNDKAVSDYAQQSAIQAEQ